MEMPLKNHALLGSQYRLDGTSGQVINTAHQRIAEMINDLDHELRLVWIPPNNRLPSDNMPYAVVKSPLGGEEYVVFNLREDQLDERVIAHLIASRTGGPVSPLDRVEALEAAQRLALAKKQEDENAEARELAVAVLKSKKNWYKHNGRTYS